MTQSSVNDNTFWDVAVIGGGPAGMMAAGRAGECGASVILLEKNARLGEKLLITGGGRCNVMNGEMDIRTLLARYKSGGKYLFSTYTQFSPQETLNFFHSHNMPTREEAEKRIFPASQQSSSVLDVMKRYMATSGVSIRPASASSGFVTKNGLIESVALTNGTFVRARSFILATGGKSHPETGSTGDGFRWLSDLGHTIAEPDPSLVPIALKNQWIKNLAGISFSGVKISIVHNNKKISTKKGKLLFTHFGVSGPVILTMSKEVGELRTQGPVELSLDLFPSHDHAGMNTLLQELFKTETNKKLKNALTALMPSAMIQPLLSIAHIDGEIFCHNVTRENRLALIALLKNITVDVDKLLGIEHAIITCGGVSPDEVDFKTMRSRLIPNLFIVGDLLDIDRPSGGFSLQLCWSTGFVAGTSASHH